jgi:hypothetical protein
MNYTPSEIITSYSPEQVISMTNDNDFYVIKEKISSDKYYEIYVDDKLIAYVVGDEHKSAISTYTLYSSNGEIIMTEKYKSTNGGQEIFYDANDKIIFYIPSTPVSLGDKLPIYNSENTIIGYDNDVPFQVNRVNDYFNTLDTLFYTATQQRDITGHYVIEKKSNNIMSLRAIDIIFLNCLEDAMHDVND